eukprot:scaffold2505_cov152-Ochromonas_danica.AAC.9
MSTRDRGVGSNLKESCAHFYSAVEVTLPSSPSLSRNRLASGKGVDQVMSCHVVDLSHRRVVYSI